MKLELREALDFAYKCFVALGLILPVISLITSGLDFLISGIDLDIEAPDTPEGGDVFNLSSFLIGMVVTGAFGLWLNTLVHPLIALAISAALGIGTYLAFYRIVVKPLKANRADAAKIRDFNHKIGVVTVAIPVNGTGEVEVDSRIGKISYMARANTSDFETEQIPKGTKVLIVGSDKGNLIVTRYF